MENMKRVCRMPLSGHLFEYTDRVELVHHIALFFHVDYLWQIRLAEVSEVSEVSEDLPIDVYGFIDSFHVRITRSEFLDGGSEMAWGNVVNEDLIRMAVASSNEEIRLMICDNPHPLVVDMMLSSPSHHPPAILKKASANPSPQVHEWLITHPSAHEHIDWVAMCGSSNPNHVDRAVEHFREILTARPAYRIPTKAVKKLMESSSPSVLEFVFDYSGGIDRLMQAMFSPTEFLTNQSAYAMEKKREWASRVVGMGMGEHPPLNCDFLFFRCLHTNDVELIRMAFDALIASTSNPWETVEEVLKANKNMWKHECEVMVDYLLALTQNNIPSSVPDEARAHLARNENPRVVDFLITNAMDNEEKIEEDHSHPVWLKMPEFLANPNDRAVAYSLQWLDRHYTRLLGDPHRLATYASFASSNTHTDMIYSLHNQFPRLKSNVVSQWMFAIGQNPHIRVVLD